MRDSILFICFLLLIFSCRDGKVKKDNLSLQNKSSVSFEDLDRDIIDLNNYSEVALLSDENKKIEKYLMKIDTSINFIGMPKSKNDFLITEKEKIFFKNNLEFNNDSYRKYTIYKENLNKDYFIVLVELYAGDNTILINKNSGEIRKANGYPFLLSNDKSLFVTMRVLEEGVGVIYEFYQITGDTIKNIDNLWTNSFYADSIIWDSVFFYFKTSSNDSAPVFKIKKSIIIKN